MSSPRIQISHRGSVPASDSYRQQLGSPMVSPVRLVVALKTTPSISRRRPWVVSMTMLVHPSGCVSHVAVSMVWPLTSLRIWVAASTLSWPWWLVVLSMAASLQVDGSGSVL